VVLAGLVAWLVADGRHQQRLLDELDARGIRRRSGGSAARG
jgi:heme exporter protein D